MKKLFKTKTFWAGIASIATGICFCASGALVEGIQTILFGIGLVTGRDAIRKVQG